MSSFALLCPLLPTLACQQGAPPVGCVAARRGTLPVCALAPGKARGPCAHLLALVLARTRPGPCKAPIAQEPQDLGAAGMLASRGTEILRLWCWQGWRRAAGNTGGVPCPALAASADLLYSGCQELRGS